MKNHCNTDLLLTGLLISSCVLSTIFSTKFSLAQSLNDPDFKSKFEPWLWEKVQELEANRTTRFMVICVSINCKSYEHNVTAAYNFKTQVATLLAQNHNATILYIGKVLSFINIKVKISEIKMIASYEFVDGLGDGEAKVSGGLDVSTTVIRSSAVVNEIGYNGSGVRVAVLDSGINASHPDFAGKDINWTDFVNGRPTPYDDHGHGTHCAGIIAGTGQASNGIYKGVAPGVTTLIIGKMLDQNIEGTEADGIAALDWAVSRGAQIISCSWGPLRDCDGQCQLCKKADECVSKGVVVVAMAHNYGPGARTITCPGTAFNVITVGAINDNNTQHIHDDILPDFSGRGPTRDGRPKPDVVAPGWNIMSPDVHGGYSNFHRTSAAAPHVAGVAALFLQVHPAWTPHQVKYAMKTTARLNDNLQSLSENDRGKGIVDASRAIPTFLSASIPVDEAEGYHEEGDGDYIAEAYLTGWYQLSAGAELVDPPENYALATLNKTFVLDYNATNPRFFFGFHDKGYMYTPLGWAELHAIFKLFAPDGIPIFQLYQLIHRVEESPPRDFDDYHEINYIYLGTLLAGQNYTIEYGFRAYAHQAYADFASIPFDRKVDALWLSIVNGTVIGVENPSFEERLKSVYEPAYWNWSNVDNDWRELKGDVNGDGTADMKDIFAVTLAFMSEPGDPNWNPDCDINGDDIVNMKDMFIVINDFNKVANCRDGAYSWYTNGTGTYHMEQWLCDHDVHALRDQQVNFSFWFKPNGTGNNATAKITYIIENGQQTTVSGNWVYATEDWHYANVTTTLPLNIIAIKVTIHFTNNFQTWIDKATIVTS